MNSIAISHRDAATERLSILANRLKSCLSDYVPENIKDGKARHASVLMPVWDDGNRPVVIFTKRSARLANHAGQMSFPGGMSEPGDSSPEDTALRECSEEIGVRPEQVRVIARLDQVKTFTGFLVTPFLGVVDASARLSLQEEEVDRVIAVPLVKVLDRNAYGPVAIDWRGQRILWPEALPHDDELIWGATARILQNLLAALGDGAEEVIRGIMCREGEKGLDS